MAEAADFSERIRLSATLLEAALKQHRTEELEVELGVGRFLLGVGLFLGHCWFGYWLLVCGYWLTVAWVVGGGGCWHWLLGSLPVASGHKPVAAVLRLPPPALAPRRDSSTEPAGRTQRDESPSP